MQNAFAQNVATVLVGIVAIVAVGGVIGLAAVSKTVPDNLEFMGVAAVGALAALARGSSDS